MPSGRGRTRSGSIRAAFRRRISIPPSRGRFEPPSCSPGRCSRGSGASRCLPPGGDVIGRRRLDTHVHAFAALGAEVELDGVYDLSASGLKGTRVYLDEASVMGTENAIMAAVLADGETVLGHAACEPLHPGSLPVSRLARSADRGHRLERAAHPGRRRARRGRVPHPGPTTSRSQLRRARRGHRRRGRGRGRRARRPDLDRACVPQARNRARCLRLGCPRSGRAAPAHRGRLRRADPEDRERNLAGVPGRPHVDRRHRRYPGARDTILIFEKMFESRLFFVDKLVSIGGADHPLRPSSRRRDRAGDPHGERLESPTSVRGWRW